MQRVDVLGDGQHITMLPLKPRQRQMGSIRLYSFVPATAEIVEVMDADRIAREGFRGRHVFDRSSPRARRDLEMCRARFRRRALRRSG